MALDLVEARGGVERGKQHERPTEPQHRNQRRRARDVEERRDREVDVVGLEPAREGLVERVGDQVAMGEHHALGPARRPAREVQEREIALVTIGGHLDGIDAIEQSVSHSSNVTTRGTASLRGPGSRSVTSRRGWAASAIATSSTGAKRVFNGSTTIPAAGTPMYAST